MLSVLSMHWLCMSGTKAVHEWCQEHRIRPLARVEPYVHTHPSACCDTVTVTSKLLRYEHVQGGGVLALAKKVRMVSSPRTWMPFR